MLLKLLSIDIERKRVLQQQLLDLGIIKQEDSKDCKQSQPDSAQKIYKIDDEFINSKLKEFELGNSPPTLKELMLKAVTKRVTETKPSHKNKEGFEKAIDSLGLPVPLPEDLKKYKYLSAERLRKSNKNQAQKVWIEALNDPDGDVKKCVENNLLAEILLPNET